MAHINPRDIETCHCGHKDCPNCSAFDFWVAQARNLIADPGDGPITNFVLIYRALEAMQARSGFWTPQIMAEALQGELTERSMLAKGWVEVPGS